MPEISKPSPQDLIKPGDSGTAKKQQSPSLPDRHTIVHIDESSHQNPLKPNDSGERRCRICLAEGSKKDKLISPCLCTGASQCIHLKCLQIWQKKSPKKVFYRCETCHYRYWLARPKIANFFGLWTVNIITIVMFLALLVGVAYGGHALDEKGTWQWKQLKYLSRVPRPLMTVLGLDWMDIVWGLCVFIIIGNPIMCIYACCQDRDNSRGDRERNRQGSGSDDFCSGFFTGWCTGNCCDCDGSNDDDDGGAVCALILLFPIVFILAV